jgi:hypothetical protein
VQTDHVGVVLGEPPGEGQPQVVDLVPEHSLGQVGQHAWVTLTGGVSVGLCNG